MDTNTVLQIISMLDARIYNISPFIKEKTDFSDEFEATLNLGKKGQRLALKEFRYHLQEYIELQVNKAENELQGSE
jgi:hypothetical protein